MQEVEDRSNNNTTPATFKCLPTFWNICMAVFHLEHMMEQSKFGILARGGRFFCPCPCVLVLYTYARRIGRFNKTLIYMIFDARVKSHSALHVQLELVLHRFNN